MAEGGTACDRGPGKVASVKSSRRRWPLGGTQKDRFHSNRQSLCMGSWAFWCDVMAEISGRGRSRGRASQVGEHGICLENC